MIKTKSRATSPAAIALGAELRAAREEARFGLRELARRAGISPTNLSHWEQGVRIPPPDVLSFLFGLLKLPEGDYRRLRRLAGAVRSPTYAEYDPAEAARMTRVYEQTATTIGDWSPAFLPVRLQARAYLWDMLDHTTPPGQSPESLLFDLTAAPAGRSGEPAPRREPIIGRQALGNPVISREAMVLQLEHLLAQRPQTLRLVTADVEDLPAFTLYRAADRTPTVVLRHARTTVYLTSEEAVTEYGAAFERLGRQALSPAETTEFLTAHLGELVNGTAA